MIDLVCPECGYNSTYFSGVCSIKVTGRVRMQSDSDGNICPALSRGVEINNRPTYQDAQVKCPNCGVDVSLPEAVRLRCYNCGDDLDKEDALKYWCPVRRRYMCVSCAGRPRSYDYCIPCNKKNECPIYQEVANA